MKKKKYYKGKSQKERIKELMDILEDGVINFLPDPEKFKAILEMKALMPEYSLRNIILAKMQYPDAYFLAGYKRWVKLGRYVKKGQKAIYIFAPRFKKVEDEETGEEKTVLRGFIPVPVFDYSQTEGEPLPIEKAKIELEGDSPEAREIIQLAETIAEKDNCQITYGDTGVANGFYNPVEHSITVSDKLSLNHRCKTLIHELVHSKVDRIDTLGKTTAAEREVVAEGSAFVVCSYFGLDTSDYSFDYVKSWASDEDNPIEKYAERIFNASSSIIQEFEELKEIKSSSEAECVA